MPYAEWVSEPPANPASEHINDGTDTILRPAKSRHTPAERSKRRTSELDVEEVGTVSRSKTELPASRPPESDGRRDARVTSSETGEKFTALALNLEKDNIGSVVLGDYLQLKEGDEVRRTLACSKCPSDTSSSEELSTRSAVARRCRPDQRQATRKGGVGGAPDHRSPAG